MLKFLLDLRKPDLCPTTRKLFVNLFRACPDLLRRYFNDDRCFINKKSSGNDDEEGKKNTENGKKDKKEDDKKKMKNDSKNVPQE